MGGLDSLLSFRLGLIIEVRCLCERFRTCVTNEGGGVGGSGASMILSSLTGNPPHLVSWIDHTNANKKKNALSNYLSLGTVRSTHTSHRSDLRVQKLEDLLR